jgi:hypothetical protein
MGVLIANYAGARRGLLIDVDGHSQSTKHREDIILPCPPLTFCLVCGLTHSLPFYTIGFMRFRSSKHPQIEAAKGFHDI